MKALLSALAARARAGEATDRLFEAVKPHVYRLALHALNNQLSAVRGYVSLIKAAPDRAGQFIPRVDDSADRAGRIARALSFLQSERDSCGGRVPGTPQDPANAAMSDFPVPAAVVLEALDALFCDHFRKHAAVELTVASLRDGEAGEPSLPDGVKLARSLCLAALFLALDGGGGRMAITAAGHPGHTRIAIRIAAPTLPSGEIRDAVRQLLATHPGAQTVEPAAPAGEYHIDLDLPFDGSTGI